MKAQTAEASVNYTSKEAAKFLAQILPDVVYIQVVTPVTGEKVQRVSKFWKIFWVVVWLLLFWPFAIFAFFMAGEREELIFKPGQYNVTLKGGEKVILTGNESCLVSFAIEANNKKFLK